MIALIVTNAVVLLTLLIKGCFDIVNRIQDRKDRSQLAKMTAAQLEAVLGAGRIRERKIIAEVQKVKKIAGRGVVEVREFSRVANGHNEKISDLRADVKDAVKAIVEKPLIVHVDNDLNQPVPITSANGSEP